MIQPLLNPQTRFSYMYHLFIRFQTPTPLATYPLPYFVLLLFLTPHMPWLTGVPFTTVCLH